MSDKPQPVYQGENVPAWQTVLHRNGTIGPACTCGTHVPDPACIHPTHTTYRSWTPGDMDAARARTPRHPMTRAESDALADRFVTLAGQTVGDGPIPCRNAACPDPGDHAHLIDSRDDLDAARWAGYTPR